MEAEVTSVPEADSQGSGVPGPTAGHCCAVLDDGVLSLYLRVDGKPKAKGRPRFRRTETFVQTFTDDQTMAYEALVGWRVKQQLLQAQLEGFDPSVLPVTRRVLIDLTFYLDKPQSTPKKVKHHLKKPDLDNLAKSVIDGLVGVAVLKDDSIVTDLMLRKRYADDKHSQGVEIEIHAWL